MKIPKILPFLLIISMLFLPSVSFVKANGKPDYVGVDVNDVFVWKVTIDPKEYEDYLEDKGYSDEYIENYSDRLFDDQYDKDVEGWKVVILEMKDEKEFDYNGDENDGVEYFVDWYTTEDYDEKVWKEEELYERGMIGKYDYDYYTWRIVKSWFWIELSHMIAANNINWEELVDEVDEELEDAYDGRDEEGSATTVKSLFEENGIYISINLDEDEFDDFESTAKFNDDGVLMYYEWLYDGDPIIILELEGQLFYENWEIILGIATIGLIVVILVVVILKRKNR
jgi:hypothetical protein